MNILNANEAKTNFGNLLLKAQNESVQINRNGKPVAVVISFDEYERIEELKLKLLQDRAAEAKIELENDGGTDFDVFFDELMSGKHD